MPSTTTPAISSIAAPDAYLQSGSSPPPTTIDREVLAQRVIAGIGSIATKLAELEPDIRALWIEFENLPKGQTILGCATKTAFCEKHLHRTLRTVQYLLNGGNAENMAQRRENISLPANQPTAAPAIDDSIGHPPKGSGIDNASWQQLDHETRVAVRKVAADEFNEAKTEWEKAKMPDFDQPQAPEPYATIIFRCETKKDLDALAKATGQALTQKTKSAWFPAKSHWQAKRKAATV